MSEAYQSLTHSRWNCKYHVVFVPKRRVVYERSCPCRLRINLPGSPVDRHRGKKVWTRELSWPLSSPLSPGEALAAGRPPHVTDSGHLPVLCSTPTPCSQPHGLRPGRHTEEQHLAQCPDVVRQSSGHGGRLRLPAFG
jgi:hypothetical protein